MCRVALEVICCRISDGLEMGLEREFMPPITERREDYPKRTACTKQLTQTLNILQLAESCCTAAHTKKREQIAAFMYIVYLTACHNSEAQTLSFTDTRSVAALHRATTARGAVMEANVGAMTATQGGLNKDWAAWGTTMEVNGDMT